MEKIKIVVAGIGGVGGYFGGVLSKHYFNHPCIEIIFLARGEHLQKIQSVGLKVIKGETEFIARPSLATNNPNEIGEADLVLICTKTYDLEKALQELCPCITDKTILLPLLNGVNNMQKIQQLFPNNLVLDGCVYLVSRRTEPGVIENFGNIQSLYFGKDNYAHEKLSQLLRIFKDAGIEAQTSTQISSIIWEKFIFLSPTATATSFYNENIGEVINNPAHFADFVALIEEIKQVAEAKQIVLPKDLTEKTIQKFRSLPATATSSMHADFKHQTASNELHSVTGYVLEEAANFNIHLPVYAHMFEELKSKLNPLSK
jgi:2-dehydropantoate 2-reductase